MTKTSLQTTALASLLAAGIALPGLAQDAGTLDTAAAEQAFKRPAYSPYAGRNFPTRPYFGDTHLHTSYSMDAGAFGCRLTPRDATHFEVPGQSGTRLEFVLAADGSVDKLVVQPAGVFTPVVG